jgi:hypothetical protein
MTHLLFYSLRVNTPRLAAKEIVGFCSEYPAACGGVIYFAIILDDAVNPSGVSIYTN